MSGILVCLNQWCQQSCEWIIKLLQFFKVRFETKIPANFTSIRWHDWRFLQTPCPKDNAFTLHTHTIHLKTLPSQVSIEFSLICPNKTRKTRNSIPLITFQFDVVTVTDASSQTQLISDFFSFQKEIKLWKKLFNNENKFKLFPETQNQTKKLSLIFSVIMYWIRTVRNINTNNSTENKSRIIIN